LRAWGEAFKVDRSLFDEIQIHYTAAPVFDKGVADPVPVRHGTVRKGSDTVPLTVAPVLPREPVERGETPESLTTLRSALLHIADQIGTEIGREDWRNLIFGLHRDTGGSDDGLALADEFSSLCREYDYDEVVKLWESSRDKDNSISAATILFKARELGWGTATPDDFVDESAPGEPTRAEAKRDKFRVKDIPEFLSAPPLSWWIKGVLPEARLAMLYGKSGSGKTFIALDMAIAMAVGRPWRGLHVKQGRVVFVCAEGVAGFRNRIRAAEHQFGIKLDKLIGVIDVTPNLMEKPDAVAVAGAILDWNKASGGGPIAAVFIDTMAQVMAGGNENASDDVGKLLFHCNEISRITGAITVLIHHSGKNEAAGARGWSGMRGACDAEYEVTSDDNGHILAVTKMKDGGDAAAYGYKLLVVPIGVDDEGDIISSCVVEHVEGMAKAPSKKPRVIGKHERTIIEALNSQMIDLSAGISEDVVLQMAIDMTPKPDDGSPDRRRDNLKRAMKLVKASGVVVAKACKLYLPASDE
jgi:hypothetical protein